MDAVQEVHHRRFGYLVAVVAGCLQAQFGDFQPARAVHPAVEVRGQHGRQPPGEIGWAVLGGVPDDSDQVRPLTIQPLLRLGEAGEGQCAVAGAADGRQHEFDGREHQVCRGAYRVEVHGEQPSQRAVALL